MRPPAPKRGGSPEINSALALSAPIPRIDVAVLENTSKPVRCVGKSVFFLCLLPCSRGEIDIDGVIVFCIQPEQFGPNRDSCFRAKIDSLEWLAILQQDHFTFPTNVPCKQ